MSGRNKQTSLRVFDLPLLIGVGLAVVYYAILLQPMFADSLLVRYTTKHLVEYVVVTFFLWGMVDVVFHVAGFPRELAALRAQWLGQSQAREPISHVSSYLNWWEQLPAMRRNSRLGRRFGQALTELEGKGTTQGFDDYLRYLADMDYEQTQSNYALLRFQCWVMPMFGFLGTVIHFGTALSGQSGTSIADNLPHVMSEMGTAFNTTTVALIAATTMMFLVFICERIERSIIHGVDTRIDEELANRFQRTDATLEPFLDVVRQVNDECLLALQTVTNNQVATWSQALAEFEARCTAHDQARQQQLARILEALEQSMQEHQLRFEPAAVELGACRTELAQLARQMTQAFEGRGELLTLQTQLSDNLRLLRETGSIDQALHGLTGAIHLITARGSGRETKAA